MCRRKIPKKSTKKENLLEQPTGENPTVLSKLDNLREDNTPYQPNIGRTDMARARKKLQTDKWESLLVQNNEY